MRKCKACKQPFTPKYSTTQITCSPCCAFEYAVLQRKKKYDLETRKRRKEFVKNDLAHQFKLTKKVLQKYAKLRDKGLPCISCGTTKNVQFCGGHFKTAGGYPELALDPKNINGQCNKNCNLALSGNISGNKTSKGYRQGIIERFGRKRLNYLERYHPPCKWTYEQLVAIRKEYNEKIRELQAS